MAKQNGSLIRKFDLMIERLDPMVELMGSVDKTLQRHETRLTAIEETLKNIHSELLEKVVHYGDRVLLHTDSGTTRAGILRE